MEGCPNDIFKDISIEEARKGDPVEVHWNAPTAEVTQRGSDDTANIVTFSIAARLIEGPSNNFFPLGSTLVRYEFRGKEKVETCSFRVYIISGKRNVLPCKYIEGSTHAYYRQVHIQFMTISVTFS